MHTLPDASLVPSPEASLDSTCAFLFPKPSRTPTESLLVSALLQFSAQSGATTDADLLLLLTSDRPKAEVHLRSAVSTLLLPDADEALVGVRRFVHTALRGLSARALARSASALTRVCAMGVSGERFSSGCPQIDAWLGGGLCGGLLTEVYGAAGSGKTQLALQSLLHAAAQTPPAAALYVATADVPAARLAAMAAARWADSRRVLAALRVRRVSGRAELLALCRGGLRGALCALGGRGVVVVDSVAGGGAGKAAALGAALRTLAVSSRAAVLVTNEVRANGRTLCAALGAAWAVAPHVSVQLRRVEGRNARRLTVMSGPAHPPRSGVCVIDKDGIHGER